jgi:transposase
MKPGLPPIWRAKADAAGAGGGCASAFRMAIIRRSPSWPGLRLSGLVAQKAFDKPMNAATFEDWVEKCLVPTLSKGDVVVMDNLSSHKGPRVEKLIEAAGAELRYLPPYSPDMNPIEKAYSKLKAFLRKIAERTVSGLMNALDACAEIFKPAECVNYFKACGYDTD